ncbi:MAG: sugar nucleotide-binding protein [Thermoguttaceae bacterium]|nr:sugar nucleotide-binding protein [Thermoguttaceae bacterium]
MKIVVVGSKGTLGLALSQFWNDPRVASRIAANSGGEGKPSNDLVVPLNLPDFDVCSRMIAVDTIGDVRPDVIVNASGVNLIDWLETRPNTARNIHGHAVSNLKTAARRTGALLVQFGCGEAFYRKRLQTEGTNDPEAISYDAPGFSEDDSPCPESVYAKTKLESERIALEAPKSLVLRFSSLFGETSEYSSGNLVDSLFKSLARTKKISVLNDRVIEPLWSIDVLCALKTLIAAGARGVYHLTGNSRATPKEIAEYLFKRCGFRNREVVGISAEKYGIKAPQSAFTVLRSIRYDTVEGAYKIPDWRTALGDYLDWRQSYAVF